MKTIKNTIISALVAAIVIGTTGSAQAGILGSILSAMPAKATQSFSANTFAFLGSVPAVDETKTVIQAPTSNDVFLLQNSSPKTNSNPAMAYDQKTYSRVVTLTGYSSTPDQTDDTPFITARGTHVRDGIVAANFLPFGTKLKIDGFGDKIFVVEDRMNKRYTSRVDIWFASREEALQFGIRTLTIHIIES